MKIFGWAHPGWTTLQIRSGELQVTTKPQNALDLNTGICDVLTPEMHLSRLEWTDGRYNKASQWCFPNPDYHRKSRGARGKTPLKTNMFAGEVNVEGEVFALPLREKRGSVDESLLKLLDSYRCDVQVDYRPDATACDYINVLGAHAAQELLGAFAEAHDQVEANEALALLMSAWWQTRRCLRPKRRLLGNF